MSNVKVSVLVPVYGVEHYIERCARSLFGQTMTEGIEFIFTDDATPDRSIEILLETLEDYPERKSQVTILRHEHNRGLGATRKTGFRAARGEYIIHCDSDDWVEPQMYELMYAEAKRIDADMVGCHYIDELKNISIKRQPQFEQSSLQRLKIALFNNRANAVMTLLWMIMFRKSFYKKVGVDIPEINYGEDIIITIPAHALARSIGVVPQALYHYDRSNPDSITNTRLSEQSLDDLIIAGNFLVDFIYENYDDKDIERALCQRIWGIKRHLVRDRCHYNPDRFRELWKEIPVEKYISFKSRIILFLARIKFDSFLKLLSNH